jgi:hypothetical protein
VRHSKCFVSNGVGHPLLRLCDAEAPHCRKNKAFKDLGHSPEWPKVADAVIKAAFALLRPSPASPRGASRGVRRSRCRGGLSGVPHGRARGSVPRHERLLEDFICHAPPLGDPLGLIKGPVHPEIDAALAIFFLGLRQRREAARQARAHVALIVAGHAVELVRDKGEGDVVSLVEVAQSLEEGAPARGPHGWTYRPGRAA